MIFEYLPTFLSSALGAFTTLIAVWLGVKFNQQVNSQKFLTAIKSEIEGIVDTLKRIQNSPYDVKTKKDGTTFKQGDDEASAIIVKRYAFDYYGTPQKYAPVFLNTAGESGMIPTEVNERVSEFYSRLLNMRIEARSTNMADIAYVSGDDLSEVIRRGNKALEVIQRFIKAR